ncbi:MAG: hypothetical protein RBQ80_04500 [Methanocorpusculum sp.]|jgi:hypothetical protein|nr:hypothetical protein [Methanocorpusculum sp.]
MNKCCGGLLEILRYFIEDEIDSRYDDTIIKSRNFHAKSFENYCEKYNISLNWGEI